MSVRPDARGVAVLAVVIGVAVRLGASSPARGEAPSPIAAEGEDAGLRAFARVADVLRHPRCLNCHTTTSFPRQGDDRHPHANLVRRGLEDRGVPGLLCATCHQAENNLASGVPGRPNWRLAPLSMGWEGLSDRDLCSVFKDPQRNGGRSPQALAEHVRHDPLVSYGWDTGEGRTPIPVPRDEVGRQMDEWVRAGAPCPR